ncbi:MAG TPA: sugar ABC transporter ATP-binding protein [Gemmatimonadaceae bacterium]|nr:sugar ABC transporter ATP-binding protein [Gemmatimonadaceae bacterium]
MDDGAVVLRATDITKAYAGVQALRRASLEVRAGEVHALVGENGAGKSTLIKILTGAVQPDAGEILLGGETLSRLTPSTAKELGIAAIYQQPALFGELTVAENIALGLERAGRWGRVDWRARHERARALLARIGARIDPEAEAAELSMPQQQLVEIARALGAEARVLILDEPTASLSKEDTDNLFRVVRELRDQGVGMIYISHRLEELPTIADRVTVLRDGTTIATREMADVNREQLIQLMVGRELSSVFPKRTVPLGDTVLELRRVGCSASGVHDVNLTVRAGEIVGLSGLVGAGRSELARTIFGLTPADAGALLVRGRAVRIASPREAIAQGIAYVPEDRRRHGVVLEMPVSENVTLAALGTISRFGALDFRRERELASEYATRLGVKTASIRSLVATLSGGNQQKVALGRWLLTKPTLLMLDEPTQGIDVGAKAEIHSLMGQLAEEGVAILMISSELPEILGMSDRVAVMHGGTIVSILDRAEATPERVLARALGERTSEFAALAAAGGAPR